MAQTVVLWAEKHRKTAVSLIAAAPDGAVVTIAPAKRTLPQNAKMWAMLSEIARAKPNGRMWTPEIWKRAFMHSLGWEVLHFEEGLNGEPFPAGLSSSRLSKSQMGELLEYIAAWAAMNDVELSR